MEPLSCVKAFLPIWRRLDLPVHLLILASLLGSVGTVAGDVECRNDRVMYHPADGRGGGEDAPPIRKDFIRLYPGDLRWLRSAIHQHRIVESSSSLEGVQHRRGPHEQLDAQGESYRGHQTGGAVAVAYQQFLPLGHRGRFSQQPAGQHELAVVIHHHHQRRHVGCVWNSLTCKAP